jgi:hypothetical protein
MALAQFCFPRGTELAKVTQMPPDPQIASKVAEKERELNELSTRTATLEESLSAVCV